MECLSSIFNIGKSFWEVTGKWFVCLIGINSNLQNLKTKIEKLRSQEEDLNRQLVAAEQIPGKTIKEEVKYWLKEVQTIKSDVQKLEKQVVEERNVLVRAWLGKCILEKIDEVPKLQENGRFSNGLVIDAPPTPTRGRFFQTERFFGGATCIRNKEKVWKHLKNDEVRRIGVYGMGGSGKTTIMLHINNELLEETDGFDNVIWVTVSKAPDIYELQDEIAKALESQLPNEAVRIRANELVPILSDKKRHVLILDDLWKEFRLADVGIPEPTSCNGCKLVITTRSLEVCRKMDCEPVEVELLTEQEELDLFMSKAVQQGKTLAANVEGIARDVAKKCKRLPLAVVTVAESIKGTDVNDLREWNNVLNELDLKRCDTDVLDVLKFSYTRLNDEKLQKIFLYCALYPYDIPKEELIEYWIAEGLIAEMNKREAMFDKGHAIFNKLVRNCLLESTKDYKAVEYVRMHDLIRDMALKITEPRFMVHAGKQLESVPYEKWSEDLERVSLIESSIKDLPSGEPPKCLQLTTLLLNHNPLSVIPYSFFMCMPRLTLLNLSYTWIKCLPGSISNLNSLQGLFLVCCSRLVFVPSLKKLKALKVLNMGGCDIKDAPQGIEELDNLRYLNLSHNTNLQTFASLKLSKLSQLQFLRIDKTKIKVAAEDLLCSRQLEVVGAHFENVQEFISYRQSGQYRNLKHYYLSVGVDYQSEVLVYPSETWDPVHIKGIELSGSGADRLVLPSTINLLVIEECHYQDDLKSLLDILSLMDVADLIGCDIKNCRGMESIFSCFSSSSSSEDCPIPLKSVEMLELYTLPDLRVLFDGGVVSPPSISFNLKELTLSECPRIKNVFPVAKLLHNFPNLKLLHVWNCEDVEDVIAEEVTEPSDSGGHHHQNNDNKLRLPNLQRLNLEGLPRLGSIYKGTMECESLISICVQRCPMLRRMPNLSVHVDSEQASSSSSAAAAAPPALKSITGERAWWESLQWDHDLHSKTTLQPLFMTLD